MSFESAVQEWIEIDQELQKINEQTKQLRLKRIELDKQITTYSSERGTRMFKYGDIKMKIVDTNIAESLTFRYLEKSLSDMIKNEGQVKQMMDYIKRNRDVKTVSHVERMH